MIWNVVRSFQVRICQSPGVQLNTISRPSYDTSGDMKPPSGITFLPFQYGDALFIFVPAGISSFNSG